MKLKYIALFLFLPPILFSETGKITFLNGTVEVQKKGNSCWEAVTINKNISNGDRIRTRLQSLAEVLLPNNRSIRIEENIVFNVKIVDQEKEKEYGALPAMEVNRGKRIFARIRNGEIEYGSSSTGNTVFVSPNQSSNIKPGADPTHKIDPLDEYPTLSYDVKEESEAEVRLELKINMNKFVFTEPSILVQGLIIQGKTNPGASVSAGSAVALADADGNFQIVVSVKEGLNTINVNSQLEGQVASTELHVFVNSKPPKLIMKKPENSRFISRERYELEGTIDDQTPMDQVDLFIDQRLVGNFSAKSSFKIPVILKEGLNELTITTRDKSGNVFRETETLFLDTVKPQIVVLQPAASGKIIETPPNPPTGRQRPKTFVVSGRVVDPQPSSGLEKVSINGVSVRLSPNGQFELPLKLKNGINELVIIALDRAGNEQQVSRGIIVRSGS